MELTWFVGASLVFVGVSYAFVQRAPRPRFVVWGLLCTSLFALATRDLFRPRERARPVAEPVDATTRSHSTNADERRRTPLFARLRSRVTAWFE